MSVRRTFLLLLAITTSALAERSVDVWKARDQGFHLKSKAAAKLELRLASGRGDASDRIRMLAWYSKQLDSKEAPRIRDRRIPLILSLIERGDARVLLHGSICVADVHRAGDPFASEEGYTRVKAAWLAKMKNSPDNVGVATQAARFIFAEEPAEAIQMVAPLGMEPVVGAMVAEALLGIGRRRYDDCQPMDIDAAARDSSFGRELISTIEMTPNPLFLGSVGDALRWTGGSLYSKGRIDWDYTGLANEARSRAAEALPEEAACWSMPLSLPERGSEFERPNITVGTGKEDGTRVSSARIIERPKPVYPMKARRQHVEGTVWFATQIGCSGQVIWLRYAGGPRVLVDSAREAVIRWRYSPALVDGRPVVVSTMIQVNFTLLR